MGNVFNYIKKVQDVETDEIESFMNNDYGPLLKISGLRISWRRKNLFIFFVHLFFILGISMYHYICLFLTLIEVYPNISNSVNSLHFILIITLIFSVILSFNCQRYELELCYEIISKNFFNYNDNEDEDEYLLELERQRKLETKFLIIFWLIYLGCTGLTTITVGPLIDYLLGIEDDLVITSPRIDKRLPVTLWTPFDANILFPDFFISLTLELLQAIILVSTAAGGISTYSIIAARIKYQLKKLVYKLETLDEAAEKLQKLNPMKNIYACNDICFNETIKHYIKIYKCTKNLEAVGTQAYMMIVVIGGLVLSMGVGILIFAEGQTGIRVSAVLLINAEAGIIFLICFYGEQITILSETVRNKVYFTNWPDWNLGTKKSLLIVQTFNLKPLELMINGIMAINITMFSSIIHTAYSCCNLLLALK